jgi:hypothetical protein
MSPTDMSEKERQERIDSLFEQREQLRKSISRLEGMRDQYGASVPLEILAQLDEKRERLEEVEQELEELQGAEGPPVDLICDLLDAAFDDEELKDFYRSKYRHLAPKIVTKTKRQKITYIVEDCDRRGKLPELLEQVRQARPDVYARFAPQLDEFAPQEVPDQPTPVTHPAPPAYNVGVVQELLMAAFSDEELNAFCQSYFYVVYNNFTQGMSKRTKVLALIDHCQRHNKTDELLALVQEENPTKYAEYAAVLAGQ